MATRPSESRYDKGGRVVYLQYSSPARTRSGGMSERARVKRIYLPANSGNLSLDGPKTLRKRTGRHVHGVALHYEHQLPGLIARRARTEHEMPRRTSGRTRVIELPEDAHDLHLLDKPPKGMVSVA